MLTPKLRHNYAAPLSAETQSVQRTLLPCLIAADGRTLEEVMRAITALTGDPWEYLGNAHILSMTGTTLSAEDRRALVSAIGCANLAQSLVPIQERLLIAPEGLPATRLTPAQQRSLEAATWRMRQPSGASVEQLLLKRLPANGDTFTDQIYVHIMSPNGLVRIGMIMAP